MYKSMLPPAKKHDYVFVTDAAYGPDCRPVCSICWSQLDWDWGMGYAGEPNEFLTGENAPGGRQDDYVDEDGESWGVWASPHRCSNAECDGGALVRSLPAKLTFANPWHPDDVKHLAIDDELYPLGEYDESGVFWIKDSGEWCHISTESSNESAVELVPPWVYITPGSRLENDIPPQWTVVDGRIKVNHNSARFKKIRKWFSDRGVQISLLKSPTPDDD